jgi:hypothetical protein
MASPFAQPPQDVFAPYRVVDGFDYQQIKRRATKTPNVNATFYYAIMFYPADGFAVLAGSTTNTLVAGP